MNHFIKIILLVLLFSCISYGQITGLSGWDIFLDPGHSQDENMGIYGYSAAGYRRLTGHPADHNGLPGCQNHYRHKF